MDHLLEDNYFSDELGQSVLSILNNLSFEFDTLSAPSSSHEGGTVLIDIG
jgi:hypothetical protein